METQGAQWGDVRLRGPETREGGARLGVKRRRGLEDVVLIQLGDPRGQAWRMETEGCPGYSP